MRTENDTGTIFDYVIVGAGSAGCVLANRLTEKPSVTVCLIEAGTSDRNFPVNVRSQSTTARRAHLGGLRFPYTQLVICRAPER